MPLSAAKGNRKPFTSAKNCDYAGIFGGCGKFLGSVKGLENGIAAVSETVYPRLFPRDVRNKINGL
jgi:hypothetical protein